MCTLAAALSACTPVAPPPPITAPVPGPPTATEGAGVGSAASRDVFWTNCSNVVGLSDAQLDAWRARGVGGFACMLDYLRPLGGSQEFTPDPRASLSGAEFDLQRTLTQNQLVSRAAARGIKLWLGIGLGNYWDARTPLSEWFNDTAWTTRVLPSLGRLAGAARMLGFAGLAFDEEPYPGDTGQTATWNWNYPGNTRPESTVRAQVRTRGAQMMQTIVANFADVEILDYWMSFPDGWQDYVHQQVNGLSNASAPSVQLDLWDGMTSVPGYGALRFLNAVFYKTPQLPGATWDSALTYDDNRVYAMLSRRLSNWTYASTRIELSPFAWIDAGPNPSFDYARPPTYVADQLQAFRRWGMGGTFANYVYGSLTSFDYTPYLPGLQAASTPGLVDTTAPALQLTSLQRNGTTTTIAGTATDNLAIRAVRWHTSSGLTGTATMTWTVTGGTYTTNYQWHMDWTATIPAGPGQNLTITVEDIKGLTTTLTLTT